MTRHLTRISKNDCIPMLLGDLFVGSIPVRVTMTENALELVSRAFLLVSLAYPENSELSNGKIFPRIVKF